MLPRDEIATAVEIQKRSYKLLRWLGDAIEREFISVSRAHGYATAAEAAREWIEEHYQNLPPATRPEAGQMEAFCNYFGSYVTTSFDLINEPGQRLASECGCFCALCSRLVNAPHLQAKKPSSRDKDRAVRKCADRLEMLAREEGISLSQERARDLAASKDHGRNAAFSAYGLSLLERMKGDDGGLHVLALWRMIAWKPEGSPIKGFELRAEDIRDAEHALLDAMRRGGGGITAE